MFLLFDLKFIKKSTETETISTMVQLRRSQWTQAHGHTKTACSILFGLKIVRRAANVEKKRFFDIRAFFFNNSRLAILSLLMISRSFCPCIYLSVCVCECVFDCVDWVYAYFCTFCTNVSMRRRSQWAVCAYRYAWQ